MLIWICTANPSGLDSRDCSVSALSHGSKADNMPLPKALCRWTLTSEWYRFVSALMKLAMLSQPCHEV